jgi:hypothetical protein
MDRSAHTKADIRVIVASAEQRAIARYQLLFASQVDARPTSSMYKNIRTPRLQARQIFFGSFESARRSGQQFFHSLCKTVLPAIEDSSTSTCSTSSRRTSSSTCRSGSVSLGRSQRIAFEASSTSSLARSAVSVQSHHHLRRVPPARRAVIVFSLLSPDQDASIARQGLSGRPASTPTCCGQVIVFPEVGGLHHRYESRAA